MVNELVPLNSCDIVFMIYNVILCIFRFARSIMNLLRPKSVANSSRFFLVSRFFHGCLHLQSGISFAPLARSSTT